jgi:hypothetical protein
MSGCAELARDFLSRRMAAHRNDPLRAHPLCRYHREQTDGAIPDYCNRNARLHVRSIGCEPARAHHVRQRQSSLGATLAAEDLA